MSLTIIDAVALAAGTTLVGAAIPSGIQRIYRSVGVHNGSGAPVVLKAWLVSASALADATTEVINRSIPAGKTDMCPELIGRGLNAGGTLQMSGAGLSAGLTAIDNIIG